MNTYTLFTQKVIGGYFPFSDIGEGFTYILGMYAEPFSVSLYGKEPSRPFCVKSAYDAENDVDVINSVQAYLH